MADATLLVKELLTKANVETITERALRSQVSDRLGRDLTTKENQSIKDEIESFLQSMELTSEQQDEEEKQSPTEPAPAAASDVGQKRKQAPSQPAVKSKAVKKESASGTTASAAGTSDDKQHFVSELKRVEVRTFKSKVLIDIRECYKDKSTDELKPGKKGLALNPVQWEKLADHLTELDTAFQAADTSYVLHLSENRRVSVSQFKSVTRVDIREFYKAADGEWKHSAKGVGLNRDEWAAFLENKDTISQEVKKLEV